MPTCVAPRDPWSVYAIAVRKLVYKDIGTLYSQHIVSEVGSRSLACKMPPAPANENRVRSLLSSLCTERGATCVPRVVSSIVLRVSGGRVFSSQMAKDACWCFYVGRRGHRLWSGRELGITSRSWVSAVCAAARTFSASVACAWPSECLRWQVASGSFALPSNSDSFVVSVCQVACQIGWWVLGQRALECKERQWLRSGRKEPQFVVFALTKSLQVFLHRVAKACAES